MGINFPLYRIRMVESIETIGSITYITTYHNKYVLDDKSIAGTFAERRLVIMFSNNYSHPIYPLKDRCTTLKQVILLHKKYPKCKFIDNNGKILNRVLSKRLPTEWKKCTCIASSGGAFYAAIVKGEPNHFVLKNPTKYLRLVTIQGSRVIIDTSIDPPKRIKSWIKL